MNKELRMSVKFLLTLWPASAAIIAVSMLSTAEVPPSVGAPVTITPEMLRQAPSSSQPSKSAPTRLGAEAESQIIAREVPKAHEQIPNACSPASGSLCFDYRAGHAVYKPMRALLPAIPGMTPHNLSLRRDKIVAQYTFK